MNIRSGQLIRIGWLLFTIVTATVLGVGGVLFRTDEGRHVVTRYGASVLSGILQGSAAVDSVGGSFFAGLEIWNARLDGDDGTPLARLPHVAVRYRLLDLFSSRIVLGQVILDEPFVNLVQMPGGRFNIEDVLGLGGGDGDGEGGGPSPLVAFRDVEVRNATLVIRSPVDDSPSNQQYDLETHGDRLMRVRHIEDLNAVLSYVRIASPFSGENGQRLDIRELRASVSDPEIEIRDASGRVDIEGRTLTLSLDKMQLPGSVAEVDGQISWPEGQVLLDLDILARSLTVNDVGGLVPVLPWNMTGAARIRLESVDRDSLRVEATDLRLRGGADGGEIRGRFGAVVGGGGLAALSNTDVYFDELSIDYLRPLLDTLPFAGRLTGRMTADGPSAFLTLDVDWTFRDSVAAPRVRVLAPSVASEGPREPDSVSIEPPPSQWPVSEIRGRGSAGLGGSEGLVFINFFLDSTDLAMETVRSFAPAVQLRGRLTATGTLNGALRNVQFAGRFRHRDGARPVTEAEGTLLLDTRRDTIGIFAALTFDSLALAGIYPSYPQVPTQGVLGGLLQVNGFADSLGLHAELGGAGGSVVADGFLVLLPSEVALRDLDAEFARLDIRAFDSTQVVTDLFGTWRGDLVQDSAGTHGEFAVRIDTSFVEDTPIDSVRGSIRFSDVVFGTNGLGAWGPTFALSAEGGLGRADEFGQTLDLTARVDSLAVLESFLRAQFSTLDARSALGNLRGAATGQVHFDGTTENFHVSMSVETPELYSDSLLVEGFQLTGEFDNSDVGVLELSSVADSVMWGGQAYSDLQLDVSGVRNASRWFARSRIGVDASAVGWGSMYTSPGVAVIPVDSVGLLVNDHIWRLNRGALVSVSDSGVVFRNFTVRTADGDRMVDVTGSLPRNGPGDLSASIVALPVADIWAAIQKDPATVDGELGGQVTVQGTGAEPLFDATLSLLGLRYGTVRIPLLRGTSAYRDRRLTGAFSLMRGGDSTMGVTVDLPIDLALEGVPRRLVDGPLRVIASGEGVDASMVDLFTTNVRNASGRLDFEVGIAGTWDTPELTGSATVTNGSAFIPSLGVTHRNLNATLRLSGDRINIESLSLESGPGTVTVAGFMRLEELTRPIIDIDLVGDRFEAINVPGFLQMTSSGEVSLGGPVFGAILRGRTTATAGVLYFADLVQKRVVDLEDPLYRELMDDPSLIQREGLQTSFSNRFFDSLTVDGLDLVMGSEVWLRSNEANIQLAGSLVIDKRARVYGLAGTLNTPRGVYRLPLAGAGKDFQVTGGDVAFFGTADLDASVDINAQRVVRTYQQNVLNVYVNMGGSLYEPVLTLTSDKQPPIPEPEIISYLLFNAPSFEAAGGGAEQRQLGLASLQLGYSAVLGSISSELERALISDLGVPIDYFQIRAAETVRGNDMSNVQIAVGRQIDDNLYVTLSPRLCNVSQAVDLFYPSVEYRVGRYWKFTFSADPAQPCGVLTTRAGDFRTQLGVDVLWDRRY